MKIAIFQMFFVLTASTRFGEHVYVEERKTWHDAQKYCRENYYDLISFTSEREGKRLKNETCNQINGEFWIGFYLSGSTWQWSGGESTDYTLWESGEPNGQINAAACWNCEWSGWKDWYDDNTLPFFCSIFNWMKVTMPWDLAMSTCMEKGSKLVSLSSQSQLHLATVWMNHHYQNQLVWIGLRFLPDRWLWMDGKPMEYKNWSKDSGDQDCPLSKRCGALTPEGFWENRDCEEELPFVCQ